MLGWGLAAAGAAVELHNPLMMACFLAAYPLGCEASADGGDACIRVNGAGAYSMSLFYAWIWAVFGWLLLSMVLIYLSVAKTERASLRYRSDIVVRKWQARSEAFNSYNANTSSTLANAAGRNNNEDSSGLAATSVGGGSGGVRGGARPPWCSPRRLLCQRPSASGSVVVVEPSFRRAFAVQALLCCLAYIAAWIFTMAQTEIVRNRGSLSVGIAFLSSTLTALQGFFNAFICTR